MNILIVAHFSATPNESGNNRFNYIAEMISKDNKVELITSSFSHIRKKQRHLDKEPLEKLNYKFTPIFEPGYKKNVCLKRFYSHYVMSKNLDKYLKRKKTKPDVIYCAVPSLNVAKVAAKYAKKNKIKFIIDVQDLWPEAFKMVFNIPIISNIIYFPMNKSANYIYKQADEIVAVSDTYLKRATKVNKKCKNKLSVFLGTDLDTFDKYHKKNKKKFNDDYVRLAYIGTLGHSYDLKTIIDATKELDNKNKKIKFIVMGTGPQEKQLKEYAKDVKVEFTGQLKYEEMVGYLCSCDIAINSISKGAAQSITNKLGDYAAAGLPVINTQESEEYRKIIDDYKIGFNCENGNVKDIVEKLEILISDDELRRELGQNNRKFAEKKFDRKKTYKQIKNLILE